MKINRKLFNKILLYLPSALVTLAICIFSIVLLLRPSTTNGTVNIAPGVSYTCEMITDPVKGSGRIMCIEVDLDNPQSEVFLRPLEKRSDDPYHFELILLDTVALESDICVVMNTTIYYPEKWYQSYPGARVWSVDTLLVNGELSHIFEHNYLFWMDKNSRLHLERTKPPKQEVLNQAEWAIGVQGVCIYNGNQGYGSLASIDDFERRSFIGTNKEGNILYMFAFENVLGRHMLDYARDKGVYYGAQLDTGSGSIMIMGRGADGVLPLTGLRGGRPFAAYIAVRNKTKP